MGVVGKVELIDDGDDSAEEQEWEKEDEEEHEEEELGGQDEEDEEDEEEEAAVTLAKIGLLEDGGSEHNEEKGWEGVLDGEVGRAALLRWT